MHASASATYDVSDYYLFKTYFGIDGSQTSANANVIFKVQGDGEAELYGSSEIKVASGMQSTTVDLNDVNVMKIVADMNGSDANDHASWGDAKLYTALAVVPKISVELPTAGKAPTKLAKTDKYTVETVWTADGTVAETFESGTAYDMTATFTAKDGYCFTDAAMADYTMTVVSEGNRKVVTPAVDVSADRMTMTVTYNSMKEVQVAYYTFDNVEGTTVYDEWGANRNGTAAEGVEYVAGKYGNAAKLSSVNNIVFESDATLNQNMCGTWTVGLWVKVDSLPAGVSAVMEGEGYINSNLSSGSNKRSLCVSTDNGKKYGFLTGGDAGNKFSANGMIVGQWKPYFLPLSVETHNDLLFEPDDKFELI